MSAGEFALIAKLVAAMPCRRRDVLAGPGDDAALLRPPPGMDLAQTVDTCLEGVHFPPGLAPRDIGWRSLAVNLSDLAAMGAEPAWGLLSLALPAVDEQWLEEFAAGVAELAGEAGLDIVGGDLVRGPLGITFALTGLVPPGAALRRAGARPGDGVWVSGPLGGGAAGLEAWRRGDLPGAVPFLRPRPKLQEGRTLRGLASAAIDISDGLVQDLGHILEASGVGAVIDLERLPLDPGAASAGASGLEMALGGGDDYQLCFTLPADRTDALAAAARPWPVAPVQIGVIRLQHGLEFHRAGEPAPTLAQGWDHFRKDAP